MRKAAAALLLICMTLNLTACYDSKEIDDMAYVVSIGIDRGISDKWRLTLQIPTMKEGGGSNEMKQEAKGSGEGAQEGYTYVSVDAPSFFTGINMLNSSIPRKLKFTHAHIIVFSEEVAKSGLIKEFIAPIIRFREIRRSAHIFVVKGTALDFIKNNRPFIGSQISKSFQQLIRESADTGFFPEVPLQSFYEGLISTTHQTIATIAAVNSHKSFQEEGEPWGDAFNTGGGYVAGQMPRFGDNKIELLGTAVFDGDIMVGELNGDETRYLLMARGEFKRGFFTMQDPKKPELIIPLDVMISKKTKVNVTFDGAKPIINLKVWLDAELLAIQSRIHYEQPKLKVLLEQAFQQTIKEGIERVIKKCQALNADAFEFGDCATKNFLTINDWESYNWHDHFKEAAVTVEVGFTIRRTGTQIKSYPIIDSEGVNE